MKIHQLFSEEKNFLEEFALEIKKGLTQKNKCLSSKYFYDERGSELFQAITQTEEYYLTRKEIENISSLESSFAEFFPNHLNVIELGVGDGHKSKILLDGLLREGKEIAYYPVDISHEALLQLQKNLQEKRQLSICALHGDHFSALEYLQNHKKLSHKLVLFLGSNLGNYSFSEANSFLNQVYSYLEVGDYLFLGLDQKKDLQKLYQAYSDQKGITAEFNLNLLTRINRLFAANFDHSLFHHHCYYDPERGSMLSYLIAKEKHQVFISDLEMTVEFQKSEGIRTEFSHKYHEGDIYELAQKSHFQVVKNYSDSQGYFFNSLWRK